MIDSDLARLYGVETKVHNQAVKRNCDRFPEDFMCELTVEEAETSRSQIVTSKGKGGRRTAYYAITEQGVAMLSSVLSSKRSIAATIEIMPTFVRLWQLQSQHGDFAQQLAQLEGRLVTHRAENKEQFHMVFEAIRQ